jgi:hypothetical protein
MPILRVADHPEVTVAPPLGENEFEGQRRFRKPDPAEGPEAERPDWLTRVGDGGGDAAKPPDAPGPPAFAPGRKYRPTLIHKHAVPDPEPTHGGPPERMSGLVGPPGAEGHEMPRLETDSALSSREHAAHTAPTHSAPAHGAATRGPHAAGGTAAKGDPDSWEGAVERVARGDDDRPPSRNYGTSRWKGRSARSFNLAPIFHALTSSRTLVLVALAAIALVAVMMFRPKQEESTSIAAIRKHPEHFEGRAVKVRGRVGEVFPVGGGYAFHLHQGREDIVVFTRSRVPVRREEVTISGSISNGILDGKTRQALFEATP